MRISDWSSDVCSSDLLKAARILDWFRRYEPVPDAEAAGAGPRVKQATNAYRFLFPAFLAKIFPARRQRGRAADSTPACEQYRQIEAARELDRMMDQLPLWELPREQRDESRSEEHTSELQHITRLKYAVMFLNNNK